MMTESEEVSEISHSKIEIFISLQVLPNARRPSTLLVPPGQ